MNDIISYFITSLDDQGISFRNPDSDLYFLPFPMRGLYFEIIVQGQFVSILFPMVSDGIQWSPRGGNSLQSRSAESAGSGR